MWPMTVILRALAILSGLGTAGCLVEATRPVCCPQPKPAVNQHGERYCARCWAALTSAVLPVECQGVEW